MRKAKRAVKKVLRRSAKAVTKKAGAAKRSTRTAAKAKKVAKKTAARGASARKTASASKGRAPKRAKAKATSSRTTTARREVPKVSPLRGTSVDDYQKKLAKWQREVVAELRQLVKSAAPSAEESIKWGQPVFEAGGPFAYVRPAAKHVTFGFWRGADLSAPPGVLEGSGEGMRHVKITPKAGIDRTLVWALVKQAARLNQVKGDPTQG